MELSRKNTGVGSYSLLQGLFLTQDRTQVSHTAGGFLTIWATREAHGCERWTIKKAKCQRIDGLPTVVLEKTPESPLDSKEIKPVNLKGDQPWIFTGRTYHLLMQTDDSLEKSLMLGKMEGWRRRGRQRMRWLDSITDAVNMNLGNSGRWGGTGRPGVVQSMASTRLGDWAAAVC